jgi:arylsulfatase
MLLSDNGACYEWGPYGFDERSRAGITHLHTGEELRRMGGPGTYHSYGSGWANLGNTPFRLYKHFTHEGGISTPFIAHWPEGIQRKGVWIRERGHVMDVLPTARAAAGADYPRLFNGKAIQAEEGTSLLPAFGGENLPDRTIYFEHQKARAIIRGDWKLVWGKRMPWKIDWELYNLKVDRCETSDLADQEPTLVEELGEQWLEYARRVKLFPFAQ